MIAANKLIHGDAIEVLKTLPDKSVDLAVVDPPYNIGKSKEWDKWKKKSDYITWCGGWISECQRVLKDNGSFYFFHNDFLQIVELQNWINKNSKFVFKQFIVWNKKFEGAKIECYLRAHNEVGALRNYKKHAEYFLFYTFQDETGLSTVMLDTNNFPTLRGYFRDLQKALGLNSSEIKNAVGQRADHCFRWKSMQWDLPTAETYEALLQLPLKTTFALRTYESLRQEYESLRQEYESLRYTFNNQKTHHSVWNYDVAEKCGHITPKPVPLIENILKYSSNEGDTVLDCFAGSGTTAIACINTNRKYILVEKEEKYFNMMKARIEKHEQQLSLLAA